MVEILNMSVSLIVKVVCVCIAALFAKVVIPWVKNDLIPWLKDKRMYEIVQSFVLAAEKLAESGAIDKELKKKFVVECLKNKGIAVTDEIDALIECAVEELDIAIESGFIMIGDAFDEADAFEEDLADDITEPAYTDEESEVYDGEEAAE